ncbi:hypothetical protein I3760_06G029700 [Carya illinoinensis]|nr:hypothetical protein I3760_06G029700 [Carya illinoinensis]
MNNNSTRQVEYVCVTPKQETGLLESCLALLCCCSFSIFPCLQNKEASAIQPSMVTSL